MLGLDSRGSAPRARSQTRSKTYHGAVVYPTAKRTNGMRVPTVSESEIMTFFRTTSLCTTSLQGFLLFYSSRRAARGEAAGRCMARGGRFFSAVLARSDAEPMAHPLPTVLPSSLPKHAPFPLTGLLHTRTHARRLQRCSRLPSPFPNNYNRWTPIDLLLRRCRLLTTLTSLPPPTYLSIVCSRLPCTVSRLPSSSSVLFVSY